MANGVAPVDQHPNAPLVGVVAALTLHLVLGFGVARIPPGSVGNDRTSPVEVDFVAPKPPESPPPSPPPPNLPSAPPLQPKLAVRRPAQHKPPPPIPNQETKPPSPNETPPTPVFGVTQDSVIAEESAVAVPVGNTLMTKDRTLAKVAPPPLPAAPLPPPVSTFSPVDEESVAELPETLFMPEPVYPEMARRLGIEGRVILRLGIDRKGNIKSVRLLHKAGYGMDEAAQAAAWQSKWKPAKKETGETVDVIIHHGFTFHMPTR